MLQIAQVLKCNGTDGELVLSFRSFDPEDLDIQEPVYINFDGLPVPFFIESLSQRGSSKALVKITGVHNLEDAEEVVGQPVFIDYFEDSDSDGYAALVGFTIFNEDGSKAGEITGIEDIPGNPCVYVRKDGSEEEVLVPLHEDFIVSIDEKTGTLVMRIPDGLL